MIMVRINGEFYNNEHWQKKKVLSLCQQRYKRYLQKRQAAQSQATLDKQQGFEF